MQPDYCLFVRRVDFMFKGLPLRGSQSEAALMYKNAEISKLLVRQGIAK